ncbi:MAG: AMP-binding protein [Promethearchaeota archaeon]
MLPKLTIKELEFRGRFNTGMASLSSNLNQSVGTFIEEHARKIGEQIGLLFEDKSWNWKQMNEECNKVANLFFQLGLKPQDTVALILGNSPEFLFITTGINKIQGITALINTNQRKEALVYAIKIVEANWIVVGGEFLNNLQSIAEELGINNDHIFVTRNLNDHPHNYQNLEELLFNIPIDNPPTTTNSNLLETAFYLYTSGTTGLPKAVVMQNLAIPGVGLSHGHCILQLTSDDVVYTVTPLYHVLAFLGNWGCSIYTGATFALRTRFSSSNFWTDIKKYKVTATYYIGEIPRYLLNQPESEADKNHTLKKILGLGLRKEIWLRFKKRFNIEHIYEIYGSTEGFGPLVNLDENPGMVGRDNVEIHALAKVDPETGELLRNKYGFCIRCKAGDIGRSLVKVEEEFRNDFIKYKNDENTKKNIIRNVFEDDDMYFMSSDFLQRHEDRWVSFADRIGDTFRWKGENVSTLEVENVLNRSKSIITSAVYGVTIPKSDGKAGMASLSIKSDSNFDIEKFSKFVAESLPKYSIPIFIRLQDQLDLTSTYKITKTTLSEEAYDINKISDPLYYWDQSINKYVPFEENLHNQLLQGTIRI